MKSFIPTLPSASTASAASAFPSLASTPTALENFSSGAKYAMSNPMQFLKGDGVALNAASALAGPVIGLMGDGLPRYTPAKEEENPFGLKRISKDFQGSFPTRPDPPVPDPMIFLCW